MRVGADAGESFADAALEANTWGGPDGSVFRRDSDIADDASDWGDASDLADGGLQGGRFVVLGDSDTDEYRADDNRGGAYASVTLNWLEQLAKYRGVDFGEWGTWGEPRRTGFERNWARSGARVEHLLSRGQVTGAANQVRAGEAELVFIRVGVNNIHPWNGTYEEIYSGSLSDGQLTTKVNALEEDMKQALETITAASPRGVLLMGLGDPGLAPEVVGAYPDSDGRGRVTATIQDVNRRWRSLTDAYANVHFVDLSVVAASILSKVDAQGNLIVGGEQITLIRRGNEPHHAILGDKSGHAGTVLGGITANETFIRPVESSFGIRLEPFSDQEILSHAGL